jgi:hypothetical protein
MPMQEFWILFLEQLPECELMHRAYEEAEIIVEARYGRRRFGSYASFRIARMRFYKKK